MALFWTAQLLPGRVTVWKTLPTHQQLMSNDNKLWGTIQGNKKQKWKDMNSTEHTKKKWVGCSFPQIVYQIHKLATNYPPLKDEGIILHSAFVFFFQHSVVDPDLCFFCLKNYNLFTCFWNMEYSCWHDLHAGLAAQKINRSLQNIWKKKGITVQMYTNLCSNDSAWTIFSKTTNKGWITTSWKQNRFFIQNLAAAFRQD